MVATIDLSFAIDWPLWAVLLVAAVVFFSVSLFYRRVRGVLDRRVFIVLVALRFLSMFLLLLCLFKPVISYERSRMAQSKLYFLLDRSKSMSIHDYPDQPSRYETARSVLLGRDGLRERLKNDFELEWYAFSSHAEKLESPGALDYQTPDGLATDLTTSIGGALAGEEKGDVAGVVLLSDGIDNSIGDPGADVPKLGVPVYAIGVGSRLREQPNYRDIWITKVEAKRTVALNTTVEISVYVDAIGYADRVVTIGLHEGEKELRGTELVLDEVEGAQKVVLRYKPETLGEHGLAIEIPHDSAERIRENNRATTAMFATEPKIKVLYIEGFIRSEYREVRRVLEQDPNIELLSLIRIGPVRFMQQGNIKGVKLNGFPGNLEELKQFDVVIIGNLDSSFVQAAQMDALEQAVREGMGFMMMGGEHSFGPGGYAGTPVERILPVAMGGRDAGQEREPFPLTLTPAGMNHPVFAGCEVFFRADNRREGVPALRGCSVVPRRKPGATVLAVNPNRRIAGQLQIVVAVQRYGDGRTMANTADTTWLWYMPLRGLGKESPFVKFWGQAVRWLGGADEIAGDRGAGVVAYSDKHFYEPGARPVFYARVSDPQGLATNFANVSAEIERQRDGQVSRAQMPYVQGSRGRYEFTLGPPQPGKYVVRVIATLQNQELGRTEFSFAVGAPNKEFEKLDFDEPQLQRLARNSKGRYFTLLSADQLVHHLRESIRAKSERIEFPDWYRRNWLLWLAFGAFVLVVTSEWILRRRRYLS